MDKDNKYNNVNNISHLICKNTKYLEKNVSFINSKKNISEIGDKFISTCDNGKKISEIDSNSLSNNEQNNNDILYSNLKSPISNKTVKSILKNKNNINSFPNLKTKKNVPKKNFLKSLLYKSICQNSNEISDYSYSSLLKKENDAQVVISPRKNKAKSKKISVIKKTKIQ